MEISDVAKAKTSCALLVFVVGILLQIHRWNSLAGSECVVYETLHLSVSGFCSFAARMTSRRCSICVMKGGALPIIIITIPHMHAWRSQCSDALKMAPQRKLRKCWIFVCLKGALGNSNEKQISPANIVQCEEPVDAKHIHLWFQQPRVLKKKLMVYAVTWKCELCPEDLRLRD